MSALLKWRDVDVFWSKVVVGRREHWRLPKWAVDAVDWETRDSPTSSAVTGGEYAGLLRNVKRGATRGMVDETTEYEYAV